VVVLLAAACGSKQKQGEEPKPQPTAPLPTAGLAGQRVPLLPLTLIAAEDSLRWESLVGDRPAALARADSVIATLVSGRAPEVTWIVPDELRRAARRAGGVVADPDHLGTALLRADRLVDVPDPLRSQLRTLIALAGGRYALIPAALVYRRAGPKGPPDGRGQAGGRSAADSARPPAHRPDRPLATAELSVVLVDVRIGKVGWRTVARGEGDDPWGALTKAVKALTPGLP
jgi:hypothetical protein